MRCLAAIKPDLHGALHVSPPATRTIARTLSLCCAIHLQTGWKSYKTAAFRGSLDLSSETAAALVSESDEP